MSFQREYQHFDVIGSGFIREHHADRSHQYLDEPKTGSSGAAWAWLAFYAFAIVTTVTTNVSRTASVVLASAN